MTNDAESPAVRACASPMLAWVQMNVNGTANVHIIRTATERESLFDLAVRPAASVPTTDNGRVPMADEAEVRE